MKRSLGIKIRAVLDEANSIEVEDSGSGMSLSDLRDIYLTIGTRSRLNDRERAAGDRTFLGEKGLGAVFMRLGWKLRVTTATRIDTRWNVLEIDWRRFSHDSTR